MRKPKGQSLISVQNCSKYGHHLTMSDLKEDRCCKLIPDLSEQTVQLGHAINQGKV